MSSLTLGIDACAHEDTLRGATVSVLGTGLDQPYPTTNLSLFYQICDRGAVVSEFPMGTTADPKHFPQRDRTISGLSQSVVVVEGGPRSDSLLTAQYALEQDRDVYAVPGPVTSAKGLGQHQLIRQGAHLAQSPNDILGEVRGLDPANTADSLRSLPSLSGQEDRIVACLPHHTGTHVGTIASEIRLPPHEVLSTLLTLELSSHLNQLPSKHFTLKN